MVLAEKKKKEANRGKEENKREEYAKPHTRRERPSYWKIGLMTMAATEKLLSEMLLVLVHIDTVSIKQITASYGGWLSK